MHLNIQEQCLKIGIILNNNYEIKKIICKGKMSIVYIAYSKKHKKKCVIKEYFPETISLRDMDNKTVLCKSPSLKDRYYKSKYDFLNEAEVLKKFKHEGIPECIDSFEENNSAYIVIEYYEGKTLDKYIKNNKEIYLLKFLKDIYIPMIHIAEYIHKKDIIHRDIKPSNIIVRKDGKVAIIDFGSAINHKSNKGKNIFVTAGYSPLEFYSNQSKQGIYSDIYSLTAILYYYLSGKVPIEAPKRIIEDDLKNIKEYKKTNLFFSKFIMKNLSIDYKKRRCFLKTFKFFIYFQYVILKINEKISRAKNKYY